MKKSVRLISLLLVAVLLLPALVACKDKNTTKSIEEQLAELGQKEQAFLLMEVADEKLLDYDSYTEESNFSANLVIQGVQMTVSSQITERMFKQNESAMLHSSIENSTMSFSGQTQTTLTKSGYQNGQMYLLYQEGEVQKTALKAPVSAAAYKAYLNGAEEDMPDVIKQDMENCTATTVRRQDGGYTLQISNFGQTTLDYFTEQMALEELGMDISIENLMLKVQISSAYGYESVSMTADIVYSAAGASSYDMALSFETQYKSINRTAVVATSLDGYTEVYDLRVLDTLQKEIGERQMAEEGNFTFKLYQESTKNTQKTTYSEQNEISYARKDGAYTFEIKCASGDNNYLLTYANGKQKVYRVNGEAQTPMQTTSVSEAQAIAYINQFIDYAGFSTYDVLDVEKSDKSADAYTISLAVPDAMKENFKPSSLYSYESGTLEITVSFKNGELVTYDTYVSLTYKNGSNRYTYLCTGDVVFK